MRGDGRSFAGTLIPLLVSADFNPGTRRNDLTKGVAAAGAQAQASTRTRHAASRTEPAEADARRGYQRRRSARRRSIERNGSCGTASGPRPSGNGRQPARFSHGPVSSLRSDWERPCHHMGRRHRVHPRIRGREGLTQYGYVRSARGRRYLHASAQPVLEARDHPLFTPREAAAHYAAL